MAGYYRRTTGDGKTMKRKKELIAAGLLAVSAVFLTVGILRGENTVVWRKAVNLCMECIGLG